MNTRVKTGGLESVIWRKGGKLKTCRRKGRLLGRGCGWDSGWRKGHFEEMVGRVGRMSRCGLVVEMNGNVYSDSRSWYLAAVFEAPWSDPRANPPSGYHRRRLMADWHDIPIGRRPRLGWFVTMTGTLGTRSIGDFPSRCRLPSVCCCQLLLVAERLPWLFEGAEGAQVPVAGIPRKDARNGYPSDVHYPVQLPEAVSVLRLAGGIK